MKHISEILIEKAFDLFMKGEISRKALNEIIKTISENAQQFKFKNKDSVSK